MNQKPQQFRLESLEPRICPSRVVPITLDPDGTLVKNIGTVNGVKFIQLSSSGGSGSVFGVPGTGSSGSRGAARVFATDLNDNGVIDADEITGIAFTDNIKMKIFGSVNGDIVGNLDGDGTLSGNLNDGSVLLAHSISQLTVRGSVSGDIIAGRAVNKVTVDGSVDNLRVGTSASGVSFHFHGPDGTATQLAAVELNTNRNGPGVKNIIIGTGVDGIFASDGGAGGNGGDIFSVTIKNDTDGVTLQAGNGGDADDRAGGLGGEILKVTINTSAGAVLHAGDGGDSTRQNRFGGDGGSITAVKINAIGPVTVTAGDGGSDTASDSKGGLGGSILATTANGTDNTFTAGDGGAGSTLGGDGGFIRGLKGILAGEANLRAGSGGDSDTNAGLGGSVRGITFAAGTDAAFIRAIAAGDGGSGGSINGDGGSISGVKFLGDIGDFGSEYGVDGMGGLFAGAAGGNTFSTQGTNGSVTGVTADRIAAIVAGTGDAPQMARVISGIKAHTIGANFDTDSDNNGVSEPAFDYFESIAPSDRYDLGETPIDGPVIGFKIGSLSTQPLFVFNGKSGTGTGNLDPQT